MAESAAQLFGYPELESSHIVEVAKLLAAERIAVLEAELGHPLAKANLGNETQETINA